jgi:hypothetical protein
MNLDGWFFSARLAWGRVWIRVATALAMLTSIGVSAWFLSSVLPVARANGTFAYHYNIYLGIDDIRPWGWAFALPAAWIGLTVLDLLVAYGYYRKDVVLASSLFALSALWALPWSSALFYLALVNTPSL